MIKTIHIMLLENIQLVMHSTDGYDLVDEGSFKYPDEPIQAGKWKVWYKGACSSAFWNLFSYSFN